MSVAAKMHPTIKVTIQIGKSKPHLYEVPKKAAEEILTLANKASSDEDDQWVPIEEVFPDIDDPIKGPAAALRGARLRDDLTQVELAKKLGIRQAELSSMENGRRPISKKMAEKLAKLFKTSYRVFL
jgi:DNA-binding XRE family transcriptional regulator